MGNYQSVNKDVCVSLDTVGILLDDVFSVKRTSGSNEAGWTVSEKHSCNAVGFPHWDGTYASKHLGHDGGWRIFMQNNQTNPNLHACGWRRLETIEPIRFDGNAQAIDIWRAAVKEILDGLDAIRLADIKEMERIEREKEYQTSLDRQRDEKEFYLDKAFVTSCRYDLYGMYEVVKTTNSYTFTKKGDRFPNQGISYATVPLTEEMGVGDFSDVTPAKIK